MKLKLKYDAFGQNISDTSIVYALLEANNAKMLIELMKNAKPHHADYLKSEIFLNATPTTKLHIMEELHNNPHKVDVKHYIPFIADAPKGTMTYRTYKENNKTYEMEFNGNTFEDLQIAIAQTGDPMLMIGFAKTYNVDNQIFLDALKSNQMYTKAYKINVFETSEYTKDEMQML